LFWELCLFDFNGFLKMPLRSNQTYAKPEHTTDKDQELQHDYFLRQLTLEFSGAELRRLKAHALQALASTNDDSRFMFSFSKMHF
jgi:hypothetical protein